MRRTACLVAAIFAAACNSTSTPAAVDYSVVLSPAAATLTAGKTLQLGAVSRGAISWSVQEAGGGSVESNGLYTAPPTPGTYHVIATSAADAKKSATATLTVVSAPAKPVITAPRLLTLGNSGTASAAAQPGMTFSWSLFNAATSSAKGASVTFSAADLGEVVIGCTATNAAGDSSAEAVAITTSIAPAATPTISAPLAVTTGRAGLTASVPATPGVTYAWTIGNGAITAGAAQSSVTFTSGTPGALALTVVAANAAGDAAPPATATVQVRAVALELLAGGLGGPGNADDVGTSARFSYATALAADQAGNAYVADSSNFSIRKVAPDGTVTTLAGGSPGTDGGKGTQAQFSSGIYGLAIDQGGTLYIADSYNQRVRRMTTDGTVATVAGSGAYSELDAEGPDASFEYPQGIAVTPDGGTLWVGDLGGSKLRRLVANPDGGPNRVVNTAAYVVGQPAALTLDPLDDIYVGNNQCAVVEAVDAGYTASVAGLSLNCGFLDGTGSSARFSSVSGISYDDSSGAIYASDSSNHALRVLTDAGGGQWAVNTLAGFQFDAGTDDGPVATARIGYPAGIAKTAAGVLFTDRLAVRKLAGGTISTLAGLEPQAGTLDGPALSARFNLFYSSYPLGVAVDDGNNAYVTDGVTIRRLSSDGVVTTFAGSGDSIWTDGLAGSASFSGPGGLALDKRNDILYVSDTSNNTVRAITYDPGFGAEIVTTVAGLPNDCSRGDNDTNALDAGICSPEGLAVDSRGRVFVADQGGSRIRLLERTADGGGYSIHVIAGNSIGSAACRYADMDGVDAGFCYPSGVAIDSQDRIFVADFGNHAIRQILENGGLWTVTTIAGMQPKQCAANDGEGLAAGLCQPTGVAADARGNLWVSDMGNAAIRQMSFDSTTSQWKVQTVAGGGGVRGVKPGSLPGRINLPGGLGVTPYGDVLVADGNENSLLLIRPP